MNAGPDGGPRRTELIETARTRWIDAPTDPGGDRRAGTLDLAQANPATLDKFLCTGSID
ncbi:hypothetical protein [Actinomadura sp. SCN-SB]|uniref:hypothetical protein n=1 Tax=Actinomadura sp. SCN-SB TaxID=3373092 RepID=UPI003750FF51